MKYKVGDKVKIREDLVTGNTYGSLTLYPGRMEQMRGNIYIINGVFPETKSYDFKEHPFYLSEEMIEGLVLENNNIKIKENIMKDFKIVNYKVYEEKAVIVEFEDGTKEKAVCYEDDDFDLERGIEVCVLKHIFGSDKYKSILKTAMKQVNAVDKAKEDKKTSEEIAARQKAKEERRKARRKEKRRKERVSEMTEAYLAAIKECDNVGFLFNNLK